MAKRPTPPPDTTRYASIETVAEIFEISPRTVRRLVASGELRGFRIGKRLLRVDLAEVDAVMRQIPTASAEPPGAANVSMSRNLPANGERTLSPDAP